MVYARAADRPSACRPSTCRRRSAMRFCLTDEDLVTLARQALVIEEHYRQPMDIEWGKDGDTGKIFILQARPETVQSRAGRTIQRFALKARSRVLATGRSIGQTNRLRAGARHPRRRRDGARAARRCPGRRHDGPGLGAGDEARGGDRHQPRRPHLSRGDHRARARRPRCGRLRRCDERIREGQDVTVSCAEGDTGYVYAGAARIRAQADRARLRCRRSPVKIMMNVGNPDRAFDFAASRIAASGWRASSSSSTA